MRGRYLLSSPLAPNTPRAQPNWESTAFFLFFFFLRKRSLGTAVRLWQDAVARTHARTRTEEEERGRGGRDAARRAAVRAPAAWGPEERGERERERESGLIPNFPRLV